MTTQTIMLLIIGLLLLGGVGVVVWLLLESRGSTANRLISAERDVSELSEEVARLSAELDMQHNENTKMEASLQVLSRERDKLSDKAKMQFATNEKQSAQMAADLRVEREHKTELQRRLTQVTQKFDQTEAITQKRLTELSEAQKAFDHERGRLRKAEDERREAELANKQRLWAEHESKLVAHCAGLCAERDLQLLMRDNTNPPEGFGTLKPDVVVQVLGKWLVVDAKTTTASRNMTQYLRDEARKAAEKYAKVEGVHAALYFVVPVTELHQLRETHWRAGTFDVFAISAVGVGAVLRAWKRMEQYAELTDLDPEEREAIVDLIARYQQHLDLRNAVELELMTRTDEIRDLHGKLGDELQSEVRTRRALASDVRMPTSRAINGAAKQYTDAGVKRAQMQQPQPLTTPEAASQAQMML